MNLEKYKDEKVLLITTNKTKYKILKQNTSLKNIKFMTKEEFIDNYFFSWDNKTIDYLISKYNYDIELVKIILKNLYAIEINKEYDNSKLNELTDIYKELVDSNLLIYNPLFKESIKNTKILVYNYPVLEKYEEEVLSQYEFISDEKTNTKKCVYHFNTLEEEVIYVIEEIIKLVKTGVDLNKIYISNVGNEYLYTIYKLFSYYHIPINIDLNSSIYGSKIVREYLKNKKLPGFNNGIVSSLINCINQVVDVSDSKNYNQFLEDKLKNTTISMPKYKNAVNITKDVDFTSSDEYLFIVGFNQDVLPKIVRDDDYLSDNEKKKINLYTSTEINMKEKKKIISIIKSTSNLYLSYKDTSTFNEYLKSSLIDELELEIKDKKIDITNSELYNKLILNEKLDDYYKYNEKSSSLSALISSYDIKYNTYNNKFKGIATSDLYNYINSSLLISYTSLNSYYECKFKYYVNYILKVNPFESNFSTVIGNLFHYIFSVMDNSLFNFEREWDNYIKKLELTDKEKFFLNNLKADLLKDIEIIKNQDDYTGFNNKLYEKEVNIYYDKKINTKLTGKIDKLVSKSINGEELISIIDYKTGSINNSINNLKYGLSMQLPIYLYLVKNSGIYSNPKIVGIYLQKVLHSKIKYDFRKNVNQIMEDNLKLQGYTTSDKNRLSLYDKDYQNSSLIKGIKTLKSGEFDSRSKVVDDELIDKISLYTERKINEAVDSILEGDFMINPKVIGKENVSCRWCKFKDICYKKNDDIEYKDVVNNLDFLEGEDNGLDK